MARVASPSVRLQRTIRLAVGPLAAASEGFVSHPRAAAIYPEYLVWLLAVMRGIGGVMDLALERASEMQGTDPVAAALVPYLEHHISEEEGHDAWVLEDLERLGFDTATIDRRVPPLAIAELIGVQYYWVLHAHPVAVLGYLVVAEAEPTPPEMVRRLQESTTLPGVAFRTLSEHAELDSDHGDELYRLIDALPLSLEQEKLITLSAMSAAGFMASALEEVVETA